MSDNTTPSQQAPTRELFNAASQQLEPATLSVDSNNEIIATFADGNFIKFPAGLSAEQFNKLVTGHQSANEGQEVITPEVLAQRAAQREASLAIINGSADTTAAKEQYNAPTEQSAG